MIKVTMPKEVSDLAGIPGYKLHINEVRSLSPEENEEVYNFLLESKHHQKMARIFREDIEKLPTEQMVARVFDEDKNLCAFRIMKPRALFSEFHYNNEPEIHGKHLVTKSFLRSKGIGRSVVEFLNKKSFDFYNISIIWGASSDAGAVALYARIGAMIYMPSLANISDDMDYEDQVVGFKEIVKNKNMRNWRFNDDVLYAWPKDEQAKAHLEKHGFKDIQHWFNK